MLQVIVDVTGGEDGGGEVLGERDAEAVVGDLSPLVAPLLVASHVVARVHSWKGIGDLLWSLYGIKQNRLPCLYLCMYT